MYLWLSLIWVLVLVAFLAIVYTVEGIWSATAISICVSLLLVGVIPTIYISECLKAYIDSVATEAKSPATVENDTMIIILLGNLR